MTVRRAFLIVASSAAVCAVIGAGIGLALGTLAPGYYRTVFRYGNSPDFNPIHVGIGLGLSQGILAGLAVGCVVVLAVAWYESRRPAVSGNRTPPPGGAKADDPEWQSVPVRRLLVSIEGTLNDALQWTVFEPNTPPTWTRVCQVATEYLSGQWRTGALVGSKPAEAFFVKCDQTTMTQDDIDAGRLVCLVGVAPVKPAEFVVFRIGQWTADAGK